MGGHIDLSITLCFSYNYAPVSYLKIEIIGSSSGYESVVTGVREHPGQRYNKIDADSQDVSREWRPQDGKSVSAGPTNNESRIVQTNFRLLMFASFTLFGHCFFVRL